MTVGAYQGKGFVDAGNGYIETLVLDVDEAVLGCGVDELFSYITFGTREVNEGNVGG